MLRISKNILLFLVFCIFGFFICNQALAMDYMEPQVKVYEDNGDKVVGEFLAFDKNFKGGGYVAMGDVIGNSKSEIVVGAGFGGGPQVRIFRISNSRESGTPAIGAGQANITNIMNFFAYEQAYKNGVSVVVCNLDNKGKNEIITGKVNGDKTEIRVYSIIKNKEKLLTSFLAYGEDFKGGVNVACGDLDRNGRDEIITGPNTPGRAQVRVFRYNVKKKKVIDFGVNFFAFDQTFKGGAVAAIGDLSNRKNKYKDIAVAQADNGNKIQIYKVSKKHNKFSVKLKREITAYDKFFGGLNIAVGNLDNKKLDEIIVAPAKNGGPNVKIFDHNGQLKKSFLAYSADFRGGVRLGIANTHKSPTNVTNKNKQVQFVTIPGFKKQEKCVKNCVALTFDDGYSSANGSFNNILNVLRAKDAKATFFMLGVVMQKWPGMMQRIIADGHQLANHSYSHGVFTAMPESQIRYELTYSDDIAYNITGYRTKPYFRYPYGAHDARTDAIIFKMGYKYYMWSASSGDSSPTRTVQSVTNGMLWNLHDGSIILAHCSRDEVAAALPTVIDAIRRAGFNLVRIDELP